MRQQSSLMLIFFTLVTFLVYVKPLSIECRMICYFSVTLFDTLSVQVEKTNKRYISDD